MRKIAWGLWLRASILLLLWWTLLSLSWRVSSIRAENYLGQIGPDVDAQLAYIGEVLHSQKPLNQKVMLSHTFYGFALVNTVLLEPENKVRRKHAVQELKWILEQLDKDSIKGHYKDTQVPHGVYYLGERDLTLAALALIDDDLDQALEAEFHGISAILYEAFMASPNANLDTYPAHLWPVDNIPALYAFFLHDHLYGTKYQGAIDKWVEWMSNNLDEGTGLMPAKFDYATGEQLNVPRGVALSMSFVWLPELAPELAAQQYVLFEEQYLETTLGFAGVREYPEGIQRAPDIDSGPIILGIGSGASGLGVVGSKAMGDHETFESLLQLAEIIGLPQQGNQQKNYLFGKLLVGDIILVWGKTHSPWTEHIGIDTDLPTFTPSPKPFNLFWFYMIAIGVATVLMYGSDRLFRQFTAAYQSK